MKCDKWSIWPCVNDAKQSMREALCKGISYKLFTDVLCFIYLFKKYYFSSQSFLCIVKKNMVPNNAVKVS